MQNKLLTLFGLTLSCFIFLIGCGDESSKLEKIEIERPNDPWVFRSVLDAKPRMITLALDDQLWAAYSTQHASIYKTWKGIVNFDGAVYTTAHGPQPMSMGDNYFVSEYEKPWIVTKNGKEEVPAVQWKGHRYEPSGEATLRYDLILSDGSSIQVEETPSYEKGKSGNAIFNRSFTLANANGAEVVLKANLSSVALPEAITTNGIFTVEQTTDRSHKGVSGKDVVGKLTLKSDEATTFRVPFVKAPLVSNPNSANVEEEDTPEGYRLIAKSGCRTCHNMYKKTIGPAYVDVAKRYKTNQNNLAMLVNKVKNGGYGNWGSQVMNAHPEVSKEDITTMVSYILSLDADEESKEAEAEAASKPLNVKKATEVKAEELLPGLAAQAYKYSKLPYKVADLVNGKPSHSGIVPTINFTDADFGELTENYSILMRGYFLATETKEYEFGLTSDDGSILKIGDQQVIDNDGLHGADLKTGKIALEKGYHPIEINYFQGGGGRSVKFAVTNAKGVLEVVPATQLVHHKKMQANLKGETLPMSDQRRIPGDQNSLVEVHPSFAVHQARPITFLPKIGGMDFLSDGRLVISTWDAEGGVYILSNVQAESPNDIEVKKIASGLAELLGVKVVEDEIYVLQKQELTKLIDSDGDDIIDEYQTVSNSWSAGPNFHEFAFGLVYKDGYFYANLAIAIEPGGASTDPQLPDRGKTIQISRADGSVKFFAHGLRTPNGIGIGVDNEIFVADNQGDWLPSCKILHITEGDFFGSRAVDFEGTADLEMKLPVVWLPQDEIGNSPSTPLLLKNGPYNGQMMHGEVTHGGLKRVFVEEVNGEYQGAVFRFIQGLEAGVNRTVYGPNDDIYVGGVGSSGNWQHSGKLWYGLQRLEYTGDPTFEMLAVRAKSNGVELEFTEPLNERDGWNTEEYEVQQWRYIPTKNYGGPKIDETDLKVKSASVSADRKKVFLEIDGIKEGHVVYVRLLGPWVSQNGNGLWSTEAWYTMNQIPSEEGTVTSAPAPTPNNTLTASEQADGWELLFDGKTLNGWRNYRKETIGSGWIVDQGAIHLNAKPRDDGGWQAKDGGDILTDKEYENYILELEWKVGNCGNSGIIYNVIESEDYDYVWQTGPEMQVLDNTCHPDAKIRTHRAGDLYDMIETKFVTVRPAGEWNQVRLVQRNGQVEHWLNGYKVVEFSIGTPEWDAMKAKSKFKDWEGFGSVTKGKISLQDHGDPIWYRNIRIKELKEDI